MVPIEFDLSQNYPNPFNPTTRIEYTVPRNVYVKLTVYNVLGQQVSLLVEGNRTAGKYTITWNASGMASGVYFYRLETGDSAIMKKMMLMK